MARQTVMHGAQIDVATPQEIASLIAQAFSTQGVTEYRRSKDVINLDATGAGFTRSAELVVPANYDLLLERITIGGSGAVAGTQVGIYENQVADIDMLEFIVIGASGKYSDAFSNVIYVTANSVVVVNVTAGTPNLQITVNLQGKLRKHP